MTDTTHRFRPENIGLFVRLWLNTITITVPLASIIVVAIPQLPFTVSTVFGAPILFSAAIAIAIHQQSSFGSN